MSRETRYMKALVYHDPRKKTLNEVPKPFLSAR